MAAAAPTSPAASLATAFLLPTLGLDAVGGGGGGGEAGEGDGGGEAAGMLLAKGDQ